jgi:hypothetical protein
MSDTRPPSDDLYCVMAIPPGKPPPAEAKFVGNLSSVLQCIPDTLARIDAIEELEAARIKSDQIATMQQLSRGLQIAAFCDSINTFTRRLDSFEQRRTERIIAEAHARDAEEQQQIADALGNLPDPDQPAAWNDDGELTIHPASQSAQKEQLEASEHPTDDTEGDLSAATALPPIEHEPAGA